MNSWLTPELALLIERGAELRRGLAFVNRAPVESVAVTLGVHPSTVEHARACLAASTLRKKVIREFQQAVERRRSSPPPPAHAPIDGHGESAGVLSARPPISCEAPDLLRDAERHPFGLEFVLRAPIETVAISFGVHPELVLSARAELSRRGLAETETEA